jgi:uncharacterized protein
MHLIEIQDAELLEAITKAAVNLGIRDGAVVSLIGAADSFAISTMPAADATQDVITRYEMPAEMTGSGEIVDGQPHLHVVMAVEGNRAIAGHLHEAHIGTWFAHAYVIGR